MVKKNTNKSIENIHNRINIIVSNLEPISLDEMDGVKLMNRHDTKFVTGVHLLPDLLKEISEHYSILKVKNERIQEYKTAYYDTFDFRMYTLHQNGKLNRYKIRHRQYVLSKIGFLEIKFKTNKGKTQKKRISTGLKPELNTESNEFIKKNSPYDNNSIDTKMANSFTRLTLVNKEATERITIDYKLGFSDANGTKNIEIPYLTIIEVKRDGYANNSLFDNILKKHRIYPSGMSKYCIGSAMLFLNLKQNRFKEKILNINKIKKNYEHATT